MNVITVKLAVLRGVFEVLFLLIISIWLTLAFYSIRVAIKMGDPDEFLADLAELEKPCRQECLGVSETKIVQVCYVMCGIVARNNVQINNAYVIKFQGITVSIYAAFYFILITVAGMLLVAIGRQVFDRACLHIVKNYIKGKKITEMETLERNEFPPAYKDVALSKECETGEAE